jgi:hypothetical protein
MIYFKSVLAGFAAALAATIIYVFCFVVLPILVPFLRSRLSGSTGSGGAGAFVGSGSLFIVAVVGFIIGFYWSFRR